MRNSLQELEDSLLKDYKFQLHPDAKKVLAITPEFFTSYGEMDISCSDRIWDSWMDYLEWRPKNRNKCSVEFLKSKLNPWWDKAENFNIWTKKLPRKFLDEIKDKYDAFHYAIRTDQVIIGICFAQFMLEGKIANELKKLLLHTLERNLDSEALNRWGNPNDITRKEIENSLKAYKKVIGLL